MKEIVRIRLSQLPQHGIDVRVVHGLQQAGERDRQDTMNAFTLAGRMDQAVLIPSFAVGGATSIMVSQNFGRQNSTACGLSTAETSFWR